MWKPIPSTSSMPSHRNQFHRTKKRKHGKYLASTPQVEQLSAKKNVNNNPRKSSNRNNHGTVNLVLGQNKDLMKIPIVIGGISISALVDIYQGICNFRRCRSKRSKKEHNSPIISHRRQTEDSRKIQDTITNTRKRPNRARILCHNKHWI